MIVLVRVGALLRLEANLVVGHPNRRPVEHRVARLREDFDFRTCTRCTTHSEALGMSGLDAEMVPHAGRVLWDGFRPLDGVP